ncbi:MAG: cache and HAMP domain-containing protein, partial [Clostridia bacterium]|nr:cache and HAMP domain-containing protein [Clostridia bacterium]
MKKLKHIVIGGIKQKIFNLVLITIILMVVAYSAVIAYQYVHLTSIVRSSSESQKQAITQISEATMVAALDSNMTQSSQMEAYIAGDFFKDAERVVKVVADYTGKLFADPDAFAAREYALPDKAKDGQISVQVLTEEGVDITDPAISEKLGLIANLTELMSALYADANVDSCYCAIPEGVMLLVDNHSGTKFDEDGVVVPIPIRDRLWYRGAAETGKLYYTDVTTDLFTGEISIMCSLPVYADGQLVAVIGADLFLNNISEAVNNIADRGSFACIVNQKGHVLFSPQAEGTFRVMPAETALDLRNVENEQLAAFIKDALVSSTEMRLIDVDGEPCYVIGSPIQNVGWTIISVVPKSLADQPAAVMLEQLTAIQDDATATFRRAIDSSRIMIIVLILVVAGGTITAATIVSKRIVKPLEAITHRVQSLGGDDLQFRMEDAFRTRNEIEVLAESFA